ncbi:DUF2314 domain-containing protein [Vibrio parahaemolyticus]|nr:DUF2314 domain-containing protein [Vibrio parahaemolyticus]EIY6182682.1 DUF2314 domain-containing protein [Vibrio parahaemolyticus]
MTWLIIILFIIVGIWLYSRFVSPSPQFLPLETEPNDPLLLAAMEKAKSTLPKFVELFKKYPDDAFVKLYFKSNTGVVEHLGAHVESINGNELEVILVTPPVTHEGYLEKNYICAFEDLEDWQVTDIEGNIYGGYTQRAMFEIAKRQGIELPNELKRMESKYIES